MDQRQTDALAALARRCHEAGIPFLLGGSGLLDALGIPVPVGDLDLMLASEDHDALRVAAGDWWRGSTTSGTRLWASDWFAHLEIDGVAIDAIGGMALRVDGKVHPLPFRSAGAIDLAGVPVPLADPAAWWVVYRHYKPGRADLLGRVVPASARAAILSELGFADEPGR